MKATQQIGTAESTPEQLVWMLEQQLARERGQRAGRARNRAVILAFGLLAVVLAGGGALLVAGQMLADLRDRGAGRPAPAALSGKQ